MFIESAGRGKFRDSFLSDVDLWEPYLRDTEMDPSIGVGEISYLLALVSAWHVYEIQIRV